MAPPELTADAPVAEIIDPVEVGVFKVLRDQFDFFSFDDDRSAFL